MVLIDKLGNYIERLDRPNSDLRYGIDDVCGITNTKQLVLGTKANLIGRTFEKFSILSPREFIFNRRTSRNGERISLGFNKTDRDWILTEDYCHFRIRKDKEDTLDPDYLYLFFLNPEFDRYARFNSWGSATEFFNWEEIIETPIPVPPIEEQRKIVHDYQVITDRIELLNKVDTVLKEIILCVFKDVFEGPDSEKWDKKRLGDYLSLERGLSYKGEFLSDDGVPMINLGNILPNSTYRAEKLKFYTGEYAKRHVVSVGDILVANTDLTSAREVIGSAIRVPSLKSKPIICSHHISIVRNCIISKYYILGLFNRPAFRQRVKGFATGTTVYAIPNETILNFEVSIPPKNVMARYEKIVVPLYVYEDKIQAEGWELNSLKDRLLEKITYAL